MFCYEQIVFKFILIIDSIEFQVLSNSNGKGVVVHRLRTKDGSFVFLQSAGCLQYDRATGQVDHWVCVSRLLV